MIDLAGRAVTPGLIDAHSHLAGLGEALEQVDLGGAATYDEVVRRVREAARDLPAGAWVRGRGWDQNRWPEQALPHPRGAVGGGAGPPGLARPASTATPPWSTPGRWGS